MKSKLIQGGTQKTFLLVFDAGDEMMEELTAFAEKNNLKSAYFTGIGAFSKATVAFFDFSVKDYKKIPVNEQVEVLSLTGNISLYEDHQKIHAHAVLGKSDGSTIGGHLLSGQVKPTLELFLIESADVLYREMDDASGIPLIKL